MLYRWYHCISLVGFAFGNLILCQHIECHSCEVAAFDPKPAASAILPAASRSARPMCPPSVSVNDDHNRVSGIAATSNKQVEQAAQSSRQLGIDKVLFLASNSDTALAMTTIQNTSRQAILSKTESGFGPALKTPITNTSISSQSISVRESGPNASTLAYGVDLAPSSPRNGACQKTVFVVDIVTVFATDIGLCNTSSIASINATPQRTAWPSTLRNSTVGGSSATNSRFHDSPISPTSFTLIALSSPPIPAKSSFIQTTITTSSSAPVTSTFTSVSAVVPSATILTSLPRVTSRTETTTLARVSSLQSSQQMLPTADSTVPTQTTSEGNAENGGGNNGPLGSCTSVAPGTKPSPAYTDPQSGLLYRIQCGTTLDLVQQCPFLCSEGGGGLFRQCQQNDETGQNSPDGGPPVECEKCLPPCGGAAKRQAGVWNNSVKTDPLNEE